MMLLSRSRIEAFISLFVTVHPHETFSVFYSTSCFFFALVLIHRFFSASLILFFILWMVSTPGYLFPTFKGLFTMSTTIKEELKVEVNQSSLQHSTWGDHGWFYISVRIGLFLWSGSRLFGFIGAGATFGQLFGSLFATWMAWLGPYLLLVASVLMELAAQSSKRINKDVSHSSVELSPLRKPDADQHDDGNQDEPGHKESSPKFSNTSTKPQFWAILDGLWLIWSSTYLLFVSLFLWLSAVISSFFYFQKVTVIATTVTSSTGRRRLFEQINSFIAVFILVGQLTLTGRILTIAGVTVAICSTPFIAFFNLIAIAVWPTWISVAVCETLRKVFMYVVTRPGRELLFTVVSQDEKYKAKVCIDVVVQEDRRCYSSWNV